MRWFASCAFGTRARDGRLRPNPAHLVHAKEIGTVLTACGVSAASWPRFWNTPFLAVGDLRRCPRCVDVVTATGASHLLPGGHP